MQIGAGPRIKKARENKDWTIQELSSKTKVSEEELTLIESGEDMGILNWKVITAIRLANTLDLNLSEVIGEKAFSEEEVGILLNAGIMVSEAHPGLKMDPTFLSLIRKLYKMGTGREIG